MPSPLSRPATQIVPLIVAVSLSLALLAAAGAAQDDIPRRHDGRPDLSGTYDIATLTPLQRPARFGERLELSPDEADAISEHWRTNFEKDYVPSDPNREAPPKGGVGIYAPEFTGAAGKVGGYNAGFVDIGENNFVLDGKYRTSILTSPTNGRYPEMTQEGKERQQVAAAMRHENTGTAWWLEKNFDVGPYDDPEVRPLAERCLLIRGATGPPIRPGMYNNLKRIVQTDTHLMLHVEFMHDVRVIPFGEELDPDALPNWLGHSVGRWEGDELVVTTTNFLVPNGDGFIHNDTKVEERFSRIDEDTLRYRFTVWDPNYSEPYSGEYPWPQTQNKVYEYACHEGNYSMQGILLGARILEQDAMKQGGSD